VAVVVADYHHHSQDVLNRDHDLVGIIRRKDHLAWAGNVVET
jgi:hypothetical protein